MTPGFRSIHRPSPLQKATPFEEKRLVARVSEEIPALFLYAPEWLAGSVAVWQETSPKVSFNPRDNPWHLRREKAKEIGTLEPWHLETSALMRLVRLVRL